LEPTALEPSALPPPKKGVVNPDFVSPVVMKSKAKLVILASNLEKLALKKELRVLLLIEFLPQ
jgi:hypothetical protein